MREREKERDEKREGENADKSDRYKLLAQPVWFTVKKESQHCRGEPCR